MDFMKNLILIISLLRELTIKTVSDMDFTKNLITLMETFNRELIMKTIFNMDFMKNSMIMENLN